ncbi:DUF4145 domain-containing protein [Pontivivens insulae]|uniref:DUF4145 domain-containing protein n=1 Tax=Pontivivens insulae TaxID=1639689 RepID=A0A2R8A693_9RHOB|nr:DUF4145 domain-containing protein [Pontivivens insulae]RED17877.1 uncharacterized protein DUF4145 [Pontivivens insulae]SPF27767.1 hypothetical protein POI8812_00060 [Pontivivens insulae]
MAINREIWQKYVQEDFPNSYPCPRCNKGQVRRGATPIALLEPHHSSREQGREEWDPEWICKRFTTMLVCDNATCGEVISVSGHVSVDYIEYFDDYGVPEGGGYHVWLEPVSMFPAPPIFPISRQLPAQVKKELKLAFQLFWTDLSASTSRLRTSLERVLDEQGVARSKPDKKGKPQRLSLFERIDVFEKTKKDSDTAESMNALRIVGNLGTHGDEVVEGDYFDLLDIYEDALAEIYEQKTARLKAKKQALIALKK